MKIASQDTDFQAISRVTRTRAQAKQNYDRISRHYDYLEGLFERPYRREALDRLNVVRGETVLEIAFGTGHALKRMAEAVGPEGKVYGIDLSSGMLRVSRQRLERAGLCDRLELICGDALNMPYADGKFDAVFSSFALELFDSPEIPRLLAETKRVLRPGGRIGIVSMSKEGKPSLALKLYEWLHAKLPRYVDCRPIYVEESLKDAGFVIQYKEGVRLVGLPGEIVIGVRPV